MPLLFWFRSAPELKFVPADEQERLWKGAVAATRTGWRKWVLPLVWIVGLQVIIVGGSRWPFWSGSRWVATLVLSAALGLGYALLHNTVMYPKARDRLKADLRRAGRCDACGYDLRGSPERCPECGAAAAALPALESGDARATAR